MYYPEPFDLQSSACADGRATALPLTELSLNYALNISATHVNRIVALLLVSQCQTHDQVYALFTGILTGTFIPSLLLQRSVSRFKYSLDLKQTPNVKQKYTT